MAELRTEISTLATQIENANLALQREALAMRTQYDALQKRCDDEIAGDYESSKLKALEPKLSAFESAVESGGPAGKKPAATTHAKTEHK